MTKNNGKKILVIEDDAALRNVLRDKFSLESFSVLEAKDGEEGLATALREHPDLILLDIILPKMDGITMSKKVKELGIKVPIIFLTNMGDLKHVSEAMETATDYIIKADTSADDIVVRVKERLGLK